MNHGDHMSGQKGRKEGRREVEKNNSSIKARKINKKEPFLSGKKVRFIRLLLFVFYIKIHVVEEAKRHIFE